MAKSKRSPSKRSKRSKVSKSSKRSKRSKHSKGSKSSSSKYTGYCVVCKKKGVKITGCKLTKASNGRAMVKGKCGVCGTTICRFVPNKTKSC